MWNRHDNFLTLKIDAILNSLHNNKTIQKIVEIINNKKTLKICIILLFILSFAKIILFLFRSFFYYDSFYFYDISKSIFVNQWQDFGNVTLIRNFQQELIPFKNAAFPFLFPFLMACLNSIINLKIYAGVVINLFLIIIIFCINFKISKKITKNLWCGLLLNYFLISNNAFNIEIISGFSIPLTLIFYQLIVFIFLFYEKINVKLALILGLIAGLNINNRFDVILPMLAIFPLISIKNKRISIKETLCFLLVFVLFLLPWIIYSKVFFNLWFASDNTRAVINSNQTDNLYFYFPNKINTIFTNFWQWVEFYFTLRLPYSLLSFFVALFYNLYLLFILFFIKVDFKKDKNLILNYILISFIFLTSLGLYTASGFFWETRYFLPIFWFISLIILFYYQNNQLFLKIFSIILIFIIALDVFNKFCIYINNYDFLKEHRKSYSNYYYLNREYKSILDNINPNSKILFIYTNRNNYRYFSIMNNIKVASLPLNIYEETKYFSSFIKDYEFDYIYFGKNYFTKFDYENNVFELNDYLYNSDINLDIKSAYLKPFIRYKDVRSIKPTFYIKFDQDLMDEIRKNLILIPTENKYLFKIAK